MSNVIVFWFRRDLRLHDNVGLSYALKRSSELGLRVVPLFIFDRNILEKLTDKSDRRVGFIHSALQAMHRELILQGSSMLVRHGSPEEVWEQLFREFSIVEVVTNNDYEQYARERDTSIKALATRNGAVFTSCKDQVIFEKQELLTGENRPYTVFTPFSKKWKSTLTDDHIQEHPTQKHLSGFWQTETQPFPELEMIGFVSSASANTVPFPDKILREELIRNYDKTRDFPAELGTTRLSVHLRFGTISIRECVRAARALNETWLNELIWRDFYMQILWNFPRVETSAFKPEYDRIPWRNSTEDFEAWCAGKTGYPIVDAGMRELNATGFMHNRVRMITASFLTKHLLIDWRWGERYFAAKLLDYDLAANNGGWQWAASTGCDAAPYFRIFNPASQTSKFDPKHAYIKRWVPELNSFDYPEPIVEHTFARERALATYKQALKQD